MFALKQFTLSYNACIFYLFAVCFCIAKKNGQFSINVTLSAMGLNLLKAGFCCLHQNFVKEKRYNVHALKRLHE